MLSLLRRLFYPRPKSRSPWLIVVGCVTAIAITLLQPQPSAAATAQHYTDLEFPPLPEIQLPDSTRVELDNGMVVYLVEDHELPLVSGSATIRIGSRFEPTDKIGLAALTGELIRTGGTRDRSADEIDATLEQIAAAVETSIELTVGTASFSALSEDTDTVLTLFADILQHPVFDASKLDLAKNQFRGSIARRNDDPNEIADRELTKLIYGATSPYARTVEYSTLDNITRRDLIDFYTDHVSPDRIILGLVGDFDTKAMKQKVIELFGGWAATSNHELALPEVTPATVNGIYIVDRPDLSQSYVEMGHLGGLRNSPDYAQLGVMNNVLNGFGGRLFDEVRSRQGLAYTVYAAWSANYDYPGLFIAGGQTRAESTADFIRAIRAEIERIRDEAITPAELQAAKDKTLNSFIFNFADPDQTLSRLIRYEYYGYPSDFIFQYQRGIEATTIADVQRVARTYLTPEDLTILVVGNAAQVNPSLNSLDPDRTAQPIDISIPAAS
ncbi:MAG: insulinase family protein [Oscillatoriales cyanobacterium]|nr:MAG: insulinase family protein [Oscillatoriales cyanobacterium]